MVSDKSAGSKATVAQRSAPPANHIWRRKRASLPETIIPRHAGHPVRRSFSVSVTGDSKNEQPCRHLYGPAVRCKWFR